MLMKIFILVFLVGTAVSRYKYGYLRVVAGRDSPPDELPYIVSIQVIPEDSYNGTNVVISDRHCTGSVIAPTWILTACHCFDKDIKMRIRFGDMCVPRDKISSYRNIIEKFRHPSCTSAIDVGKNFEPKINNDIALALIEEIPIKSLVKLSAVEYSSLAGVSVVYAGFGSTVHYGKQVEDTTPLQVGLAGVVACSHHSHFLPAICFVGKCLERTHPIYGDSGGPLMYERKIVGVFSGFGMDDAVKKYVTRAEATPVSPYLDWIFDVMQNAS